MYMKVCCNLYLISYLKLFDPDKTAIEWQSEYPSPGQGMKAEQDPAAL